MHASFKIKPAAILIAAVLMTGCVSSVKPVGSLGPQQLQVYNVTNNDFLSSSHMLVVLDKKGNVAAFTGGTVSGYGTVGLQTGASLASAGAIYYGAKAIQNGVKNAAVNVKTPSDINANVNVNGNVTGSATVGFR